MVQLNDILHYRKPDARAGLVVARLIERIEYFLLLLRADAYAVVGDLNDEMCLVGCNPAFESDMVAGIRQGIGDRR